MANSHLDLFGNSMFEETTAYVWLDSRDYGPTTRDFGLQFHVRWQEFEAFFYVGDGNNTRPLYGDWNNTRPLGNFRIRLSDLIRKTVLEAFFFLEGAAIRAGIEPWELRYTGRPLALRAQDVWVQLFRSPNCHLPWPGEPNHDEDVAAQLEEQWKKLNPIVCLSPHQARVEAENRAAVAARSAERNGLHAPIDSPDELRSHEEMKARSLPLIRVNDLARELKVNSKVIMDAARHVGIRRKVKHSDSLGKNEADRVGSYLRTPAVRSDCA